MNHFKLLLKYRGEAYHGWQTQPGIKTIQETILLALQKIAKSKKVGLKGCSRTDAGVHALGQVARATLPISINAFELKDKLNRLLPENINCIDASECPAEFCPQKDLIYKEYIYIFSTDPSTLHDRSVTTYPYELDIDLMKKACLLVEGQKDFFNFSSSPMSKNTIRTIFKCTLVKKSDDKWQFTFHGDGFLKYMIRYLVGTIFKVGRKKISLSEFESFFLKPEIKKPSRPARVDGLYLSSCIHKNF